jgi:hypothetical protein
MLGYLRHENKENRTPSRALSCSDACPVVKIVSSVRCRKISYWIYALLQLIDQGEEVASVITQDLLECCLQVFQC